MHVTDPQWQTWSLISLGLAGVCFLVIVGDLLSGNKQKMGIMNIVWPVTALYSGPFALVAYFMIGRKSSAKNKNRPMEGSGAQMKHGAGHAGMHKKPFWQSVVVGTLHCGSGCTLGDLIAEFGLLLVPVSIFGSVLYGGWLVDYIIAFLIGIIFQYYAIKPMKDISTSGAIGAALKADTLSLTFWQIGMYGWMAISTFLIFHTRLDARDPLFWFMMQIGMLLGFVTAFPINWWLIRSGIKETM